MRCSQAALLVQLAQHPHTYATRPTQSQQHTKASWPSLCAAGTREEYGLFKSTTYQKWDSSPADGGGSYAFYSLRAKAGPESRWHYVMIMLEVL